VATVGIRSSPLLALGRLGDLPAHQGAHGAVVERYASLTRVSLRGVSSYAELAVD
jgi:hypothetical protein